MFVTWLESVLLARRIDAARNCLVLDEGCQFGENYDPGFPVS